MFETIPLIAVIAASFLAVAVGNVWHAFFGLPRIPSNAQSNETEPAHESFRMVGLYVLGHFIFFTALSQLLPFIASQQFTFLQLAIVVTIIAGHQYVLRAISERHSIASFLIRFARIAVIVFGGMAVINYWPW